MKYKGYICMANYHGQKLSMIFMDMFFLYWDSKIEVFKKQTFSFMFPCVHWIFPIVGWLCFSDEAFQYAKLVVIWYLI